LKRHDDDDDGSLPKGRFIGFYATWGLIHITFKRKVLRERVCLGQFSYWTDFSFSETVWWMHS